MDQGVSKKESEPPAATTGSLFQSPIVLALIVFLGLIVVGESMGLLIFSIVSGIIFAFIASIYQRARYEFLRKYSRKTGKTADEIKGDPQFSFLQYGQYWDLSQDKFFVLFFLLFAGFIYFSQQDWIALLLDAFYVYFYYTDNVPRIKMAGEVLAKM